MKKSILFIAFAVIQFAALCQHSIVGSWEGKIASPNIEARMIFTIKQDGSKFSALIDVPDHGVKGIAANDVMISNDSVIISVTQVNGFYRGKIQNESTITGSWMQGIPFGLQLKKVNLVSVIQRPQTPVAPFPYKSEDIIYFNKDKTIQYGATFSVPSGNGPFPTVVLLTGSGQQNRDEEIAGHKPFAVIADHLTRNGFAVLRTDDRGMGVTTGDVMHATTLDFCNDAATGLDYLISRKEVDKNKLVLLGHSEGAMIAQMLATKRKDVAAIVLMAGPGKSGAEVLIEQNRAIFLSNGLTNESVDAYIELYTAMLKLAKHITNKDSLKNKIALQVTNWLETTPKNVIVSTTGITDENKKATFIDAFTESLNIPWFRYFINYQPEEYLQKLTCKIFALNGSKDLQVIASSNLQAIEMALKNGKTSDYKIKEYEGLNHLFQHCKSCSLREYGNLEETISIEVLHDITAWLQAGL